MKFYAIPAVFFAVVLLALFAVLAVIAPWAVPIVAVPLAVLAGTLVAARALINWWLSLRRV